MAINEYESDEFIQASVANVKSHPMYWRWRRPLWGLGFVSRPDLPDSLIALVIGSESDRPNHSFDLRKQYGRYPFSAAEAAESATKYHTAHGLHRRIVNEYGDVVSTILLAIAIIRLLITIWLILRRDN